MNNNTDNEYKFSFDELDPFYGKRESYERKIQTHQIRTQLGAV